MTTNFKVIGLLGVALGGACAANPNPTPAPEPEAEQAPAQEREFELVEGERMYTLLAKDDIPAIDDPTFVSAEVAAAYMRDEETVLGVVGRDGTVKAYSTWHLDGHEIVNDMLDGVAIAATW